MLKVKGYVIYGDNNKGKIIGKGKVGAPLFTSIEDVLYVEGLKHNLLSISQLCDKGFKIKFTKGECLIEYEVINEVKLKAHIHMEHLNKLVKRDLVIGLPNIKFVKDKLCDACQKGKQTKSTFKLKNVVSTTRHFNCCMWTYLIHQEQEASKVMYMP